MEPSFIQSPFQENNEIAQPKRPAPYDKVFPCR